jgi:hypothetical protein
MMLVGRRSDDMDPERRIHGGRTAARRTRGRADASSSALAVTDVLPTCIDGWATGKGQIALHRRKASSTAAWMLRLLTASPTR